MEEFLAREKAALEALEAVEIGEENAMQIDDPPVNPNANVSTKGPVDSGRVISPVASPRTPSATVARSPQMPHPASPPPTTPRGARIETAAMQEWKAERTRRIAERDTQAEQVRQERRRGAQADLETFKKQWGEETEERRRANRQGAGRGVADRKERWDAEEPCGGALTKEQLKWGELGALLDALPKPSKDCSRLLGIIKSLSQ